MIIFCYILLCSDRTYYTGITKDLKRRFLEHSSGRCKSTRNKRPLKIIFTKQFDSYQAARKLEKHIKGRGARRYLLSIKYN